ncbi:hypothetical protein ANO14919_047880 [Xylariales sp. No.14919]|nr:hypothetical protein ANO14919_047880 [Xylariales sp. No.14919]
MRPTTVAAYGLKTALDMDGEFPSAERPRGSPDAASNTRPRTWPTGDTFRGRGNDTPSHVTREGRLISLPLVTIGKFTARQRYCKWKPF